MHNQLFNTLNITLTTEWVAVANPYKIIGFICIIDECVWSMFPVHTMSIHHLWLQETSELTTCTIRQQLTMQQSAY